VSPAEKGPPVVIAAMEKRPPAVETTPMEKRPLARAEAPGLPAHDVGRRAPDGHTAQEVQESGPPSSPALRRS